MHAHTTYRDPRLAALSQEEIQQLDAITRKLLPPASVASQDGPYNQKESNAATETVDVDSQDAETILELPGAEKE